MIPDRGARTIQDYSDSISSLHIRLIITSHPCQVPLRRPSFFSNRCARSDKSGDREAVFSFP